MRQDITKLNYYEYYNPEVYFNEAAEPINDYTAEKEALPKIACTSPYPTAANMSLEEYLKKMDKGFREMLFDLIEEQGITDVQCYKKANVDKRTFSKIKSNPAYKPSKTTAIAFAIALELDLDMTQELLSTVGYTLSKANVFDKIIRYFIYITFIYKE